jgi:hypothetical protein
MKKNEGRDEGPIGVYWWRFLFGMVIMAAVFSGLLLAIDHLGLMSPAGEGRDSTPPMIERFEANPGEVRSGESSILSWNVSGVGLAANVSTEPEIGPVAPDGEFALLPEETTTYKISASNYAGRAEARVTVTVLAAGDGESQPSTLSESETRKI